MMAMGSKYVLAVQGRHIFNPAAIGAVTIGLVGLNYATWWVATPLLLPATLLFAFLILYKTRRLKLGLLFLGVAVPLIVISSILNGQTLLEAITLLPSWPLLFFVGFMLSEPLTLPPRRWQRYTVGTIVAILFALPVDIGGISSTPAIALVTGNAVAYLLVRRRHIQLTFKERRRLSTSSYEYVFDTKRPINYIAGQYMEITMPHAHKDSRGIRRIFSIVSPPNDMTIRFGIKMYDKPSSFKQSLRLLESGDVIDATGIGGDFILPKSSTTPLLFIAGGIGITPFISHLLYLRQQDEYRDIILIYSVSAIGDLAYIESIKDAGIQVIVVTENNARLPIATWTHHNAQYLTKEDIARYIPDASQRSAYVSGPPQMVDATKSMLKQVGAKSITCDYFTGY
jgi:ferredoxin-NADP reductase